MAAADAEDLLRNRGAVLDGRFPARPDIERRAVVFSGQVEGDIHERFDHIVNVDEIAGNVRVDQLRVLAFNTPPDQIGDETGRVFERSVYRIQAQVRARKPPLLPVIKEQVRRSRFRDRVVAVRLRRSPLVWSGGIVAVSEELPACRYTETLCSSSRAIRRETRLKLV